VMNGDTSTRRTIRDVKLRRDEVITVEGVPDGEDPAGFDYLEFNQAR